MPGPYMMNVLGDPHLRYTEHVSGVYPTLLIGVLIRE